MKVDVLILGGGLAGLACARELHRAGADYLLVEREREEGGLCRTVEREGFRFDYTGHFLHFQDPAVEAFVRALPGLRLRRRRRHAVVYSRGVYTEYPYQENTAGLPEAERTANVTGLLEALLRERFDPSRTAGTESFRNWARRAFGDGVYRNFMEPYNRKLWKVSLDRLTTRWMKRFVPRPRLDAVLEGAFRRRPSSAGYNATFLYPLNEGIAALPRALARGLPRLVRGVALEALDLSRRTARLNTGVQLEWRRAVSTLPLKALARRSRGLPFRLARAAEELKSVSVYSVNLGLRIPQPHPYSWVYFPEPEFPFHRAGSLSACVPEAVPRGKSSLYVEFSYRGRRPPARWAGAAVLKPLAALGWIRGPRDVQVRVDLDLPGAYVVYDRAREIVVPDLLAALARRGVECAGRYGLWEYGSMESAIAQGRAAAWKILGAPRA